MPLPPIDTSDLAEMRELISALRAEAVANERLIDKLESELAVVPKWTRIDPHDRTTWPPSDNAWVLNYNGQVMFVTWGSVLNQVDLIRHGKQWWMPITPPKTKP